VLFGTKFLKFISDFKFLKFGPKEANLATLQWKYKRRHCTTHCKH